MDLTTTSVTSFESAPGSNETVFGQYRQKRKVPVLPFVVGLIVGIVVSGIVVLIFGIRALKKMKLAEEEAKSKIQQQGKQLEQAVVDVAKNYYKPKLHNQVQTTPFANFLPTGADNVTVPFSKSQMQSLFGGGDDRALKVSPVLKSKAGSILIMVYDKDCPYTPGYAPHFAAAASRMDAIEKKLAKRAGVAHKPQMIFATLEKSDLPVFLQSDQYISGWPSFLLYSPIDNDLYAVEFAGPDTLVGDIESIHINIHEEKRARGDWVMKEDADDQE